MKRKRFGKEIRKAVHNKYNRHCAYCGTWVNDRSGLPEYCPECGKKMQPSLTKLPKEEQSMSKVVVRYFQKCDMCNQEFQLECEKAELGKAILPGRFIPGDGSGPTPRLIPVHLCPACLQEMSEYLRNKYILNDVEYVGIQIGKLPTMEETNNE